MNAAELKELRKRRGETQEEFARHFNVGRTNIANWERNGIPRVGAGANHIARVIRLLQLQTPQAPNQSTREKARG